MLAGATIDWLIAFPLEARPKALCDRFPHVANRLAKQWKDKANSAAQRAGPGQRMRAGAVPASRHRVQAELQRLLTLLT